MCRSAMAEVCEVEFDRGEWEPRRISHDQSVVYADDIRRLRESDTVLTQPVCYSAGDFVARTQDAVGFPTAPKSTAVIFTAHAETRELQVYVDDLSGERVSTTVNGRIESAGRVQRAVWVVGVTDGLMREMWSLPA